jgi:putative aldouronate transport system substrate-binding protein
MERRRWILAWCLSLTMIASAWAGGAAEESNTAAEIPSISYATYVEGPVNPDSFVETYLEETFNVELDVQIFERSTWTEQLGLKLASGEIPDMFQPTDYNGKVHFDQRIIAPFDLQFIKDNAPNWFEKTLQFNETYDCQLWAQGRFDGENNYVIPGMQFLWISPWAMEIRKDWMDNVGISSVPKTLPEFEELLEKFTYGDPDGNGKDDTYGILIEGKDDLVGSLQFVFTAYGAAPFHRSVMVGDKPVEAYRHPGYKLAVKKIAEWYEKGYLDPEFVTIDWTTKLNHYATGKVGVFETTWYRVLNYPDDYRNAVKTSGAETIWVRPPAGPSGTYGYPVNDPVTGVYVFGQHLTDEPTKWKKMLEMMDRIGSDLDVYTALNGQEGMHFDITDTGLAYKPEYDSREKRADIGSEIGNLFKVLGDPDFQKLINLPSADMDEVNAKCRTNVPLVLTNAITIPRPEEISKDLSQIGQKLWTVHQEWLVSFIMGDKSVDRDWSEYMAEVDATGIGKYRELFQEDAAKRQQILDEVQQEIRNLD